MIDVEQLYYSEQFQNMLSILARKKSIRDVDDFKHDVFIEILSSGADTKDHCKRAAWRVAYQHETEAAIDNHYYGGPLPA